jgi:hypothetical protein
MIGQKHVQFISDFPKNELLKSQNTSIVADVSSVKTPAINIGTLL